MKIPKRDGASVRLQAALSAKDYPRNPGDRKVLFMENFGLSDATAQRMLTGDYAPSRGALLEDISAALDLSPAYWTYGVDKCIEDIILFVHSNSWEALLLALRSLDKSSADLQPGMLVQLADMIYENAMQGDRTVDPDYVNKVLTMAISMHAKS